MNNEKVLDISWGTILKIALAFLGFYILYLIRDILVWFIFALIISLLFNPAIDFLQKRRVPRALATLFIYIFIFGILGFFIYLIAPVFISEIQQFTKLFPQYFEKFAPPLKELGLEAFESFEIFTKSFQEWLIRASASIFSGLAAIFGGIFSTITIFILAIFLSLEEKGTERAIRILSPKNQEQEILNLWESCQAKVSGWFGAKILACIFVGVMSYIALQLFKINYPFALALFAGLTNIISIVGPIIAGLIIALIAALDSWLKAALILIVFIIIQQIEGNILTPILTKRFIGLPPALVLISLLVGGRLWGILGAILAIPLAGIVFEFTTNFLKKRKENDASHPVQPSPVVGPKKSIIW
ncbi:MAG: AI-2E family transporter [Patescibacteria group bacterium]|nr:AI-2E family transporter [Patescibacteria group bacterium]